MDNIESFKGLRSDPRGFYLVLLPLGIRWALLKYHIKPLGIMKNLRFLRKPLWVWFVFIPVEIIWSLQRYYIELKRILKRPIIFTKPSSYPIRDCSLNQHNENKILSTTHKILQKKYAKAWRLLFAVMFNLFC